MQNSMTKPCVLSIGFALGVMCLSASASGREVWIEAESFDTLGGWVIDQQSMDQMGSAYVMAHGMGMPVQDAETVCGVPESGHWTIWARTRDWTAPWKRGKSGGIFKVLVNGKAMPETLGTHGGAWGWQKAGTVVLEAGSVKIALHDLTGFNGRCDALYLTLDPRAHPENDKQKLAAFRRRITKTVCKDDPTMYDLAVAGGGMAGICTAVSAACTRSKVILIQDRPVLGGNNSSEVRVGLGGFTHVAPYPNLGNVVAAIGPIFGRPGRTFGSPEVYEDGRKERIFSLEGPDRCRFTLNERVVAVERDGDDPHKITALIARNIRTGAETRYRARLFADCTGDAFVARKMGAKVMYGREPRAMFHESLAPEVGDHQVMGLSVLWRSKKAPKPTTFPDVDWGIEFKEHNAYYFRDGDWEWETGQYRDQAEETEYIRDYGMMAIYANWSFLKNHSKRKSEWANDTLDWVSPIGGKRESYRVVGDHILTQNDITKHIAYPDATASITWNLDLHYPDPDNVKKFDEPFISSAYHRNIGKPYPVPYRCLYAKDVKNLFLAGRDISATHVAFSAVRVQRTLGMLGEVVGMAASICAKENLYPRDVHEKRLEKLKSMMKKGVPLPTYGAFKGNISNTVESYHFQDLGFIRADSVNKHPEAKERVEKLNVVPRKEKDRP